MQCLHICIILTLKGKLLVETRSWWLLLWVFPNIKTVLRWFWNILNWVINLLSESWSKICPWFYDFKIYIPAVAISINHVCKFPRLHDFFLLSRQNVSMKCEMKSAPLCNLLQSCISTDFNGWGISRVCGKRRCHYIILIT